MINDQSVELYKYCVVEMEAKAATIDRLVMRRSWSKSSINPICSIESIGGGRAIYSTNAAMDTVDLSLQHSDNGSQYIKIMFCHKAKSDLTIVLNHK